MAAKLDLAPLPSFDPHSDQSNLAARWKTWIKRFHTFIKAANISNKTQQRALLLYQAGPEVQDIFETLANTGRDDDLDAAIKSLTEYFAPAQNTDFEIFRFRQAKQQPQETLENFHTRLRKLAQTCLFSTDSVDNEIKQQIIQGCSSSSLRKYALKTKDVKLQDILVKGKTDEISKEQAKEIEKQTTEPTEKLQAMKIEHKKYKPSRRGTTNQQRNSANTPARKPATCYNCGFDYPHRDKPCPAQGKTCSYCKKQNHFTRCCKQRQKNQQNREKVNTVKDDTSSDDSSEEYVYCMDKTNAHTKKLETKLTINGQEVLFLIDTGASVNILDEKSFDKINTTGKPVTLKKSNTKIFAYGSKAPLQLLGTFEETVETNKKISLTRFHVAKNVEGNLLSSQTAQELHLIKININSVQAETKTAKQTNSAKPTIDSPDYVNHLLEQHKKVFKGVGNLKDFEVKLHTNPEIKPVIQAQRRIPFHIRKKVETELDRLEKDDIIEKVEGATQWVSPLVITPKKNSEEIRICVDMRLPNTSILRTRHPMPTTDELISDLNGACHFSKLDLKQGYHQLTLAEESRNLTTFTTHKGLRRYKRLCFGVNSAAEIFQNTISQTIQDISNAKNMSDDVIIWGKTLEEHNTALTKVLQRFEEKGITLNEGKCRFNKTRLQFYGLVFSKEGVSPDPSLVQDFANTLPPKNVSEVRSLLGMSQYCAKFIQDYASITEPLRRLTQKNAQFQWGKSQQEAFEKLKETLLSDPVMAYFDIAKHTTVTTDASPYGISAILSQTSTPEATDHKIVAYVSRSLTPVEQRYSQTEREALGLVWGIERLHLFLYGAGNFDVFTDHKALETIFNNPVAKPPARIERWQLRLQNYSFTVKFKKGSDNPSDYMSRHPASHRPEQDTIAEEYVNFITKNAVPKTMTLQEIEEETEKDQTLQAAIDLIRRNRWHEVDKIQDPTINKQDLKILCSTKQDLTVKGDIILKGTRIVIPQKLRHKAIELAHKPGHSGTTRTKSLLREKVWFPYIDKMVKEFVEKCIACQATGQENSKEPMQSTDLPPAPWHTVKADFFGPVPSGEYLLSVIDTYSRFPEVEIVKSTAAGSIIPKLDRIFGTHGIPVKFICDNGPPFNGIEIETYMKTWGIEFKPGTPLWPRQNAEVESFNRPLKKLLQTSKIEGNNWRKELHLFLLNYRSTPHCTTQVAPAELLFNRVIRTKIPVVGITSKPSNKHKLVQRNDKENKAKAKVYYDKRQHTKPSDIREGDLVLVKQERKNKLTSKFDPKPYRVIEIRGTKVIAERSDHKITRNISFFKKFYNSLDSTTDSETDDDDTIHADNNIRNDTEPEADIVRQYPVRLRTMPMYYGQVITH